MYDRLSHNLNRLERRGPLEISAASPYRFRSMREALGEQWSQTPVDFYEALEFASLFRPRTPIPLQVRAVFWLWKDRNVVETVYIYSRNPRKECSTLEEVVVRSEILYKLDMQNDIQNCIVLIVHKIDLLS